MKIRMAWKVVMLTAWMAFHASFFTSSVNAQTFGYASYDKLLQAMPDYVSVRQSLDDLRAKFDEEMKRSEEEFSKKYEQFMDGQRDFAPSILRKRQSELQEMMERNQSFKAEAERLLRQAEEDAFMPLHNRLTAILAEIGQQRGYAFILNTDHHAVPFLNPALGEDVTAAVLAALGVEE